MGSHDLKEGITKTVSLVRALLDDLDDFLSDFGWEHSFEGIKERTVDKFDVLIFLLDLCELAFELLDLGL